MPYYETIAGRIEADSQGAANVLAYEMRQQERATAAPEPAVTMVEEVNALAGVMGRLEALEEVIEELGEGLNPELPDRGRLEELAVAINRTGILREELVAVGDAVIKQVQATAGSASDRLQLLDESLQAMGIEASTLLTETQAEVTSWLGDAERRLSAMEATVRSLRGPRGVKGDVGLAGASTTVISEDPTAVSLDSLGERWLGRGVVPGDAFLQIGAAGLRAHRWTGGGWDSSPELAPKTEIISQRFSGNVGEVTESYVSNVTLKGGVIEATLPILIDQLPVGPAQAVVEAWDSNSYSVTEGQVTALEGTLKLSGDNDSWLQVSFSAGPGPGVTTILTEYAELSSGDTLSVDSLSIERVSRVAGTSPDGTNYPPGNGLRLLVSASGAGMPASVSGAILALRAKP